jgi:hypothetical protein
MARNGHITEEDWENIHVSTFKLTTDTRLIGY